MNWLGRLVRYFMFAGVTIILLVVTATEFWDIREGKPRHGSWAVPGTTAVIFGAAMLVTSRRWRKKPERPPEVAKPTRARTSSLVWTIMLVALGILIGSILLPDPPARGHREAGPWARVLGVGTALGILVALVGGLYGVVYLRNRKASAILKRAREGDADGAIEALRAEIAVEGPTLDRTNLLGVLLGGQDRWEEADEQFQEGIRLKGRKAPQLTNHAVAVWKLGRAEEAALIFEEVAGAGPLDLLTTCNYCHVLADLGRVEEARAQLVRAEALAADLIFFDAAHCSLVNEHLEESRAKVLGLEGVKKGDLTGLDEL